MSRPADDAGPVGDEPVEDGPVDPDLPQRADPRRTFRGPASATLVLEAISIPLVLPVMANIEGGITGLGLFLVIALTIGMIVGCVVVSKPWGLRYIVGLQVVMLLSWGVSTSLGVLGVIFGVLWVVLLWMRREVIRRQAAWPATP